MNKIASLTQVSRLEMYYNNPQDFMSRLELLAGSILAGNGGVKDEFTQIALTLSKN